MPAQPGDVIAGYRVVSLLGSGGMGDVYVVEHPQLKRKEAMKVISVAGASNTDFQQRFANEARTAASLDHPNIITVHSYGVDGAGSENTAGVPWFTMSYLDGPDMASTRLTPAETVTAIAQVADGLDYAHARAVVHRDIKPANVVITRNTDGALARTVVLDFGIAKLANSPQLTAMNSVVGTMAYTAPEIISGHPASGLSDQYALACTTYHVLTGHAPFEADTATALMMAHVQQPPPPLGQARPDLAALGPVLARALAKDPNARYKDCREFAAELHRAFTRTAAGTATAIAPTPPPPGYGPPPQPTNTPYPAPNQPHPSQPGYPSNPQQPGFAPAGPGMPPGGPPPGNWIPNPIPPQPPKKNKRGLLIALAVAAVAVIAVAGTSPLWWPSSDEPAEVSANQSVAMAYGTVCSIHEDKLFCWGNNDSGQLGDGSTGERRSAARVGSLDAVTAVAVGGYLTENDTYVVTTCAAADGSAYCWGNNHYGQVGDGTDDQRTAPVKVPGLENVTAVASSMGASCAIAGDNEVYCWGNGEFGQLGTGNTSERVTTPTKIPNLTNATDLSAAGGTVCAIADSELHCWGDNRDGQLGDGSTQRRTTPVKVKALQDVESVSVGSSATKGDDGKYTYYFYSCAVAENKAYCWGSNAIEAGNVQTPREVTGIDNADQITMDVGSACVVTDGDDVKCWGNNRFGQVGNGSSDDPIRTPTTVGSLSGVRYVATGTSVTCATTEADTYCWGTNTSGQLGNQQAPSDKSMTPVKVAF